MQRSLLSADGIADIIAELHCAGLSLLVAKTRGLEYKSVAPTKQEVERLAKIYQPQVAKLLGDARIGPFVLALIVFSLFYCGTKVWSKDGRKVEKDAAEA